MTRQSLHSIHIGVDLNTTIGSVGWWVDLEQRAWVKADHLGLAARVRGPVPSCEKLQNVDAGLGLGRDPILDVEGLESVGTLVDASEEEGSKGLPNLARVRDLTKLDIIGDLSIFATGGSVLHHDDVELLAHKDHEHSLNVAKSPILPGLTNHVVWNLLGTEEDERIFKTLIDLEVGEL